MLATAQPRRTRIFVLSDRAIFRDCLLCFLNRQGFEEIVGAANIAGLRRRAGRREPDLVLLDLRQDRADPRELLHRARKRWPDATVVALGTPLELAAHAREADGCLELPGARARDIVAIAIAVEKARDGHVQFPVSAEVERERRRWNAVTARERDVLDMLASGADNLKMAAMLGISERAVKAHITSLFGKLGVENRTELAVLACHAGLHCPASPSRVPFRAVEDFDAAS
jgi:two-component system, NarL family, nitrate/nitrite response regulator NarL